MRIAAFLAAAALAGLAAGPAAAADVGKPAPAYSVVTFSKEKISSEDLKGKVVVLNYWATWCAPCKLEMVVFDDYMRKHPGTDLRIYAIATESSIPDYKLRPLASVLSFPLISKLSGRGYGPIRRALPTSYVIDRNGVVRHAKAGAFTAATFDALVTPLLKEPPPQTIAAAQP